MATYIGRTYFRIFPQPARALFIHLDGVLGIYSCTERMSESVLSASKTILAVFLFTNSLFAQFGIGLGVKGGIPFTDLLGAIGAVNGLPPNSVTRSNEYLIGPAVELRIPLGFA